MRNIAPSAREKGVHLQTSVWTKSAG